MHSLKSIAYILLFCFSVLFVVKANSNKTSFSTIEKQLDDIEKNVDAEDGFEKIDEKAIEDDDFSFCEIRFRANKLHNAFCIAFDILPLKRQFPLFSFSSVLQPIIGIFTPPPNF